MPDESYINTLLIKIGAHGDDRRVCDTPRQHAKAGRRQPISETSTVGRPNLQQKRQTEILDRCEHIVIEEGLAAVTVSRLGRELGMDRTTIHHHVGSLSEIHEALIKRVIESFLSEASAPENEPPNIERYLETVFSPDFLFRNLDQVIDEFEARAYQDDAIRAQVVHFYEQLERNAVDYVIAALPELPKPVARELGQSIYALLEGAYLLQNWGRPKNRMKSARNAARTLVQATLDAHR